VASRTEAKQSAADLAVAASTSTSPGYGQLGAYCQIADCQVGTLGEYEIAGQARYPAIVPACLDLSLGGPQRSEKAVNCLDRYIVCHDRALSESSARIHPNDR
jgi:hypothetical protein